MWNAYDKYFRHSTLTGAFMSSSKLPLPTGISPLDEPLGAHNQKSLVSVLKDILGLYMSLRSLWNGQDKLVIASRCGGPFVLLLALVLNEDLSTQL